MPELVGGALHVDVEAGAPISLFSSSAATSLCSFDSRCVAAEQRQPALAAARGQVDHGAEALGTACLRREHVRLVDHDQRRVPERARRVVSASRKRRTNSTRSCAFSS
jgi:hypothetical protein